MLEALYTPYLSGADFDWSQWDEAQFRSAELQALFEQDARDAGDGVGRLDFDPYIDGQDYDIRAFAIGEPAIVGNAATVPVTFTNFGLAAHLDYTLVEEADGWKVDDVTSRDTNFPYSLKALLEAPL